MPVRPMPAELRTVLRRAREVELAAVMPAQRHQAITATSRLVLACLDAGWRIHEVAAALELARTTVAGRVERARHNGLASAALYLPSPPMRRSRPQLTREPVAEREWLTLTEAAHLAGVAPTTIARWRKVGVLPNALLTFPTRPLYLRADINRVTRHPRWRNGATDLRAIRAEIARVGI